MSFRQERRIELSLSLPRESSILPLAVAPGEAYPLRGSPLAIARRVTKRVLIVDDMQYLRDVQVLLLKDAGYAATALGNAREALDRLPELAPDLILLDVSMPGMDGRQFLARLRSTPEWERVPVILTTGRSVDDVARENGCEVLSKPFSEVALLDRVRKLIGDARNGSS
ncbi:MAG TPA: response regulator [Methylomirabilota bacterium]|jgi:CheY-like chemotaxis protein|nr:response regulator [Methylomirabilota bacterium]